MSAAQLSSYLTSHLRGNLTHTHTCFANGIRPLHIDESELPELRNLILNYVNKQTTEQLLRGVLALTEKVVANFPFRYFADIDFKTSAIAGFAEGHGNDFPHVLTTTLQDMVRLYREVVSKALGLENDENVDMILTTRLPYKIHLHFPGVIVKKSEALALFRAFEKEFSGHSLYSSDVLDKSVYSTGLRTLWSHKGAMVDRKKQESEIREHETLFGAGSWTGVYEVTDIETWEKKTERTLVDLEATSIIAGQDETISDLSNLRNMISSSSSSAKATHRPKRARLEQMPEQETRDTETERSLVNVSEGFQETLRDWFNLNGPFDVACKRGDTIIFPIKSKVCPYAKREHTGNHIYLVLSKNGVELRCHNATCKKKKAKTIPMDRLTGTTRTEAEGLLGIGLDVQGLEQIRTSVREVADHWPGLDVSELGVPIRSGLDSAPGYLTQLTRNRYCPICQREHDAASNCILTTEAWQRLICARTLLTDQIPTSREHTTIFAAIGNVNVNVNVGNKEDEDGEFKEVFPITEDPDLNVLLLESFSGFAYDIGMVYHHLGRECLGLGRKGDTDVWWVWNKSLRKWQESNHLAAIFLSKEVTAVYKRCKTWFRDNTFDVKLAKVRMAKMDVILRRLRDRDKYIILRQAAEIFVEDGNAIEERLDANPYLLGFEGDVYDLQTGVARKSEPQDYVSRSVGYPFPYEDDLEIQAECMNMIRGTQPKEAEMDYLLRFLASTLDGCNTEEIFTIWTGGGRNGKSLLVDLMSHALNEKGYFHPLQASFLTNERPSSSKPCPDLLNIRAKRFACASEPEGDKKMNAGFVKLLTGNDMLTGSYKHSNEEVQFRGHHSLVLLCNGIPAMDAKDDALWLRSRVVEFAMRFVADPKEGTNERLQDATLKKKIAAWGPQFMRILLKYYQRYQLEGLRPTEAVLRATGSVQKENDPFHEFIEEHYELTDKATDRVPKSEVNEAFEHWCQSSPERRILCKRKFKALASLKQAMEAEGFDLGEEMVNGKPKAKNKRVNGESQPAYDFIVRKR